MPTAFQYTSGYDAKKEDCRSIKICGLLRKPVSALKSPAPAIACPFWFKPKSEKEQPNPFLPLRALSMVM
jgi:hypothetical protein